MLALKYNLQQPIVNYDSELIKRNNNLTNDPIKPTFGECFAAVVVVIYLQQPEKSHQTEVSVCKVISW